MWWVPTAPRNDVKHTSAEKSGTVRHVRAFSIHAARFVACVYHANTTDTAPKLQNTYAAPSQGVARARTGQFLENTPVVPIRRAHNREHGVKPYGALLFPHPSTADECCT